jgi:hypothetical protein
LTGTRRAGAEQQSIAISTISMRTIDVMKIHVFLKRNSATGVEASGMATIPVVKRRLKARMIKTFQMKPSLTLCIIGVNS